MFDTKLHFQGPRKYIFLLKYAFGLIGVKESYENAKMK